MLINISNWQLKMQLPLPNSALFLEMIMCVCVIQHNVGEMSDTGI